MMPITSIIRASGLYETQRVYGDRIKAYKTGRPTVQLQADTINISKQSMENLEAHRKTRKEKEPIAYSNPKVRNSSLNKIGASEREIIPLYSPPPVR